MALAPLLLALGAVALSAAPAPAAQAGNQAERTWIRQTLKRMTLEEKVGQLPTSTSTH